MFDILFRNAKIIDGTGNPWFYGDVGVLGGSIAAVLPPGSDARARRIADVDGKALCPGFVDGHSHSELPILAGEAMDCKIMQGVTTENLGLDGMSLAPIRDRDKADWKKHLSGLAGTLDVPWTWNGFAGYLDCLQAAKPPLNVSSYVGLGTVRLSVMGMIDRPADAGEIAAMRQTVSRCMAEGARGQSSYEGTYRRLLPHLEKRRRNIMVTPTARRFWDERLAVLEGFVQSLALELGLE